MTDLSPIELDYRLSCTPEQAFDVYASRIGEWWDRRYTADAETFEGVTIEPHVGGRVYESHRGGGEHDWGEVTRWERGRRLVHSFALAQDPGSPSEVAVEFEPSGNGCLMHFSHGGWTDANVSHRRKFGDWPALLGRFAALAQR